MICAKVIVAPLIHCIFAIRTGIWCRPRIFRVCRDKDSAHRAPGARGSGPDSLVTRAGADQRDPFPYEIHREIPSFPDPYASFLPAPPLTGVPKLYCLTQPTRRSMGRVVVYIATSLDGFIARKDDDISWLDPFSGGGEDYGYQEFIRNAGTAVMGARTYEQSIIHPERLLICLKNYVLTRRPLPVASGIDTEFWDGPLTGLVKKDTAGIGQGCVCCRLRPGCLAVP